ncbi:MAG: FecCD family ABC transporter permease [Janthinobacterium lividum]
MRRALVILGSLAILGLLACAIAVACGSSGCLASPASEPMIWMLRFPRVACAYAVGGLLALAGALMQVLLRNPLADPYVLGISGGAAAGAMAVSLLAPASAVGILVPATAAVSFSALFSSAFPLAAVVPALLGQFGMQIGALCGALVSIVMLFALARGSLVQLSSTSAGIASGTRLILMGAMIASGFGALLTLMLSLAPDARLRSMVFWLMGDLDNDFSYTAAWLVLACASIWAMHAAPRLNVLAHGDQAAFLLGVPVVRLRAVTLLVASLATAAAVSVAGTIGFIGLVVPHGLRLLIGNDQRLLLPASVLGGGLVLTLADLAARTAAAPLQLPVGVITALFGVPVFLFLLARSRA